MVVGGKPGAGRLREGGTPPSVSGRRALCKGVCHSYVRIDRAPSVDTGGKGLQFYPAWCKLVERRKVQGEPRDSPR